MDYDRVYDLLDQAASICDDGSWQAEQEGRVFAAEAFLKARKILEKAMDNVERGY